MKKEYLCLKECLTLKQEGQEQYVSKIEGMEKDIENMKNLWKSETASVTVKENKTERKILDVRNVI